MAAKKRVITVPPLPENLGNLGSLTATDLDVVSFAIVGTRRCILSRLNVMAEAG
ncbi:MAG: hypothetical protein M3436_12590 [Pseudomonadota bacterium]|nr:hypothetical protein [Pseudomonadota bacterium]